MPRNNITVAVLAAMIALLLATSANAVSMGASTLPPYTGVIKNNTACEFSIPSQNSMGTLIVPARGWIEYVVWDPKFEVIPYYKGNPFGCQWVTVTPKAFCLHVQKLRFHGGNHAGPGPVRPRSRVIRNTSSGCAGNGSANQRGPSPLC